MKILNFYKYQNQKVIYLRLRPKVNLDRPEAFCIQYVTNIYDLN